MILDDTFLNAYTFGFCRKEGLYTGNRVALVAA